MYALLCNPWSNGTDIDIFVGTFMCVCVLPTMLHQWTQPFAGLVIIPTLWERESNPRGWVMCVE